MNKRNQTWRAAVSAATPRRGSLLYTRKVLGRIMSARLFVFAMVSLAALAFELWRMYSRDIPARARENQAYLDITEKPRSWIRRQRGKWANRKVKAYVRCPHCHAEFALPKGKGKLRATCPKCGKKAERVFSTSGIVFSGSGFYNTDQRDKK